MESLLSRLDRDDLIEPRGLVTGFSRSGPRLHLRIELRDAEGDRFVENWRVSCVDVHDYQIAPEPGLVTHFGETHSAVKQFVDSHVDLFFNGRPASAADLLLELQEAHDRIAGPWIPLARYLRASLELLNGGFGKVFSGPRFLADAYAPFLEDAGLQLSWIQGPPARETSKLELLEIGDSFVIGAQFTSEVERAD